MRGGYAERKGWTVADDHVYVDDGISGAEFENRPGLMWTAATGPKTRRSRGASRSAL